jgi:hypothetical protein
MSIALERKRHRASVATEFTFWKPGCLGENPPGYWLEEERRREMDTRRIATVTGWLWIVTLRHLDPSAIHLLRPGAG